ncbi:MAG: aspartate aminotransferase family protein [Candidatus Latescibacteria bacterium]|nr:aspartate aminotransferase family protein [Candidatus Latescibacterota bacterium]
MKTDEVIALEKQVILQTYTRPPFVLERGNGVHLFDTEGNRYLDFVSGIAVNAFGYGDYDILETLKSQASRLIHCSNLYFTEPQVELARLLVAHSFADKAFFCNSGTEAIEGVIKFARRWGHERFDQPKTRIITMTGSFHGRTYGALSATGQPKFQRGFEPMVPGFATAPFNDLEAVRETVTEDTCAILVEPLQGESGVNPADQAFLEGLRSLCDERKMLLIFDEIQFGLARSGALFAYQHFGVEPDLMTLAKPLAGGLPVGAVLLRDEVAQYLVPGDHGTTFGGGPLVCSVACKVFEKMMDPKLLEQIKERGAYLHAALNRLKNRRPQIKEVRGFGLIAGVVTEYEPKVLVEAFRKRNVLVCTSGKDAVRFLPPLIIEKQHVDEVVDVFDEILEQGVE